MSVEVHNESGYALDEIGVVALARYVLDRMKVDPLVDTTIFLVDADTIAVENETHMGKLGPTDVLAFPIDDLTEERGRVRPGDGDPPPPTILGNILICPQVAASQAAVAGHSVVAEIELLATHGILHLLGYDHGDVEEEREMFGLQARLLADWRADHPNNRMSG